MKLKKVNNKFNHFLISRYQENKLFFRNDLGEVFYFVSYQKRIEYLKFLNEQLKPFLDIKFISIFKTKTKDRNILAYSSKDELSYETKKSIGIFIKTVFKIKFNIKIDLEMVDFKIAKRNSLTYNKNDLKKIVKKVIEEKSEVMLPAYTKEIRRKINMFLIEYKRIKIKTTGSLGDRRIRIIYNPEK
ncbi:hypothetical protein [Spiroplasma sp. BIUS-1]|uniref:hypothetical protein n=1 Tax=Spiroplasma sp. BIUS-1 TaxID=216964 RepID=UPI0013994E05|nr:hypothetical protein [Spiroplasma sp. BIUS-1]QHX37091.1 hypothetical protein SBIUS_v1c08380 [Spiroplasma sp. BIUS-1]